MLADEMLPSANARAIPSVQTAVYEGYIRVGITLLSVWVIGWNDG